MNWLITLDRSLFLFFNRTVANPVLDWLMPIVTESDNWTIPMVLIVLWLLIWGGNKGRVIVLMLAVLITLSDQLSASVFKQIVRRLRPCHPDVLIQGGRFLLGMKTSFSFPSSHATNMAAAATLFSFKYPRSKWIFIAIAAMVAYSRVYVGVHYPLDILAGALLGVACGGAVIWGERGVVSLIENRKRKLKLSSW